MHKFPIPIAHDVPPSDPASVCSARLPSSFWESLWPRSSPRAAICHAQWCQVLGTNVEASTPLLDSLHQGVDSGHRSFWDAITPCFQRVPWSPKLVLLIGVILMMLGMLMLKL